MYLCGRKTVVCRDVSRNVPTTGRLTRTNKILTKKDSMSKRRKRQKSQKTKRSLHSATQKENKRRLPSLQETEAYIKEHNLEVMNPLSDFGFKRLLASERNKDILMHLLNVFISEDTGIITDISHLPTEVLGIRKEDKFVRYDLYCTNQDGKRFIVEMQNGKQSNYADRLRVYSSLATVHNWDRKDKLYERVPKIYSFNMMSYEMSEEYIFGTRS